ncbi:MAG TPA: hypothetical protein VI685_05600 [Candidatus Angelobacter sp.]
MATTVLLAVSITATAFVTMAYAVAPLGAIVTAPDATGIVAITLLVAVLITVTPAFTCGT